MGLFYALKSTVNHLNRLPMMPPIIYGPIFDIECIKKGFPFPQVSDFEILLKKYKMGMGILFYTFNIKNRTIYDMWHHGSLLRWLKVDFNV